MGLHSRRSIRLQEYDYSAPGAYFITMCSWQKECLFGEVRDGKMFLNEYGEIAKSWWHKITERYEGIALDEYIVMPNHFHGIVSIETTELNQKPIVGAIHELPLHESIRQERRLMLLLMLIGCFKMNTSKHINHLRKTPGCPVWQRNYYERIIRDETELGNIRKYVLENPAKWMDDKYYRLP